MTKTNDFSEAAIRESRNKYVNEVWTGWRTTNQQTLNRITNYLFVLNTGALLSALTYVATNPANNQIKISIWFFAFGIFCSVVHAALDYYFAEYSFRAYKKDVDAFYSGRMDWKSFVDRNEARQGFDWILHLFGWLGGAVFFWGLILGLLQIQVQVE